MNISAEHLLSIARNYWPGSKADDGEREHKRLTDLWDQELKKLGHWWAFLDELKRVLPGFTIGNATATPDACFRCAVYSPDAEPAAAHGYIVVGCMSILAPFYTIYGVEHEISAGRRRNPKVVFAPFHAQMQHIAEIISRKMETTFDVRALAREVADTPIPLYVEPMEPPNTTLFHALFTSEPHSLP